MSLGEMYKTDNKSHQWKHSNYFKSSTQILIGAKYVDIYNYQHFDLEADL